MAVRVLVSRLRSMTGAHLRSVIGRWAAFALEMAGKWAPPIIHYAGVNYCNRWWRLEHRQRVKTACNNNGQAVAIVALSNHAIPLTAHPHILNQGPERHRFGTLVDQA